MIICFFSILIYTPDFFANYNRTFQLINPQKNSKNFFKKLIKFCLKLHEWYV